MHSPLASHYGGHARSSTTVINKIYISCITSEILTQVSSLSAIVRTGQARNHLKSRPRRLIPYQSSREAGAFCKTIAIIGPGNYHMAPLEFQLCCLNGSVAFPATDKVGTEQYLFCISLVAAIASTQAQTRTGQILTNFKHGISQKMGSCHHTSVSSTQEYSNPSGPPQPLIMPTYREPSDQARLNITSQYSMEVLLHGNLLEAEL